MPTKVVDSKGRLALGAAYAGRMVIVEQQRDQIIITPAVAAPEREAWLFANATAKADVTRGLAEARARSIRRKPPEIDVDS